MPLHWNKVDPAELEAQFYQDVTGLFENSSSDWYATEAYRSPARQQTLWNQGRTAPGPIVTNAKPGESAHQYNRALDVALDGSPKPGLQMLWNWKAAGWLWLRAKIAVHPRLQSGWKWGDWPHIQVYKWRTRPTPVQNLHRS